MKPRDVRNRKAGRRAAGNAETDLLQQVPLPASNWLRGVTVAFTALCLVGIFSKEISDTDFWWHLRTGQWIVSNHTLPVPDPFSFTSAAAPVYAGELAVRKFNLVHQWLGEVLQYLIYLVAGFPGIIAARALLLTAVCGLTGLVAGRLSGGFYAGVAAAFAASSVLVSFAADRPALITFLCVAVYIALLEFRRGWWALPLVAVFWANCHAGFFLGWVVLLAYCAESRSRKLWLISALAVAASGLNPNGFGVVATLLAYRRSSMLMSLIEWMPPRFWSPPYGFWILLAVVTLVLAISWRKVRLTHWILFVAFAAASLTAFRNLPLIGILAPILIAAWFPFRGRLPALPVWLPPVLAAAGLLVVGGQGAFGHTRVAEWVLPSGAADYLERNHVTGPVFNTYEQGGYLIWRLVPQAQVFMDGRDLSEAAYRDYQKILFDGGDQMTAARAELLNRYGVRVVVMNTMDFVSGKLYPLALALANPGTPDWQLVYEDTQAVVFRRNPPPDTPPLPQKLGRVLKHLNNECAAYVENSPEDSLCARTLADYWMRNQVKEYARRMLRLYLAHAPQPDEKAERALRDLELR